VGSPFLKIILDFIYKSVYNTRMKEMTKREEKTLLLRLLQEALLDSRPLQARIIIAKLHTMPLSFLETELIANYDVLIKRVEAGRRWDWYGESENDSRGTTEF